MTDPRHRTFVLAVGLLVAGGVVVFFSPRSAMLVLNSVVGGLVAVAALHVVSYNAPPVWWTSPFDRKRAGVDMSEVDEAAWIRSRLAGRRVRIGTGEVALPPETLRLLRPLIAERLAGLGAAPRAPSSGTNIQTGLSALTFAVLQSDPTIQPGWLGTVRPDERAVAEIVHRVLDDLERIDVTTPTSKSPTHPPTRPARHE